MKEIYFVHDQQESATARKSFLELSGYKVSLFRTGLEVTEALAARKPDLLLIDVLIDGPNGFETCRRIRSTYAADVLPIVLSATIYRSRVYRDEAAQAGAQHYFVRPAKLEDLAAAIADVLAGRRPAEAA